MWLYGYHGAVVPKLSESARDVAEQKLPPSDEKNTIKNELRAGTITYAISAVAAIVALMFWIHKIPLNLRVSEISGALALTSSVIGMSANGHAYHTAQAFFSDGKLNDMLTASIISLSLHALSVSILAIYAIKNRANIEGTIPTIAIQ